VDRSTSTTPTHNNTTTQHNTTPIKLTEKSLALVGLCAGSVPYLYQSTRTMYTTARGAVVATNNQATTPTQRARTHTHKSDDAK
jgi:hypothetical protein